MQLKKYGLNLISVTALGIGSVVGAGIFALLGQVIMMAGDQTYYAFIIAGVAALFSGYSYSRLAAAYPDSGGLTDYFHIAFKKRWVVGTFSLIYMMTSAVSICMMAKSFGIYIMGFDRIMYDVKNYKRQNNTLQGTVRLWTSDGLGAGYVSVCLSDFYLQYPQISVDVVCSLERPKNLDKMDICIIYEEPGADMTTVFKGRLKFGLFASLDYLSVFGRPKSIEDLQKNHKICTRDNFASVWPRWKEILDGAQNVVASTNATAVLLSLIRDGNGVSLHPIGSASREKDLVFLSELGYGEEHDFWIATRKDYVQRPEVKVLIECIRDATLKI